MENRQNHSALGTRVIPMKIAITLFRAASGTLLVILLSACSPLAKGDQIDLASLLIGMEDMPSGWITTYGPDIGIDEDRSLDSARIVFNTDLYPESLGASQNVYRFRSVWAARRDYGNQMEFYEMFHYTLSDWKYKSNVANESYFSCRKDPETPILKCDWIARYDKVVIEFGGWLIPNRMTMADMENVIREIDSLATTLFIH